MDTNKTHTLYRIVGLWDLLLTFTFALPGLNVLDIELLKFLNTIVSPNFDFPAFGVLHMFFVQLFGIMAVLWAVIRIHKPLRILAIYDTAGRAVVGAVMAGFSFTTGCFVPLLFCVSEFGFGIVQAVILLKPERSPLPNKA